MLEETWKSLRESWLSRAINPLSGALVVSWMLWNHRLLVVLFLGDLKVTERFAYIDNVLYPTWIEFTLFAVIGPLASALAYIYLLPWPSRKVLKFTLTQRKDMLNDAKQIQGLELLTEAESQKLRDDMFRLEAESQDRRRELEKQIEQWKALHSDVSAEVRRLDVQLAILNGAAALTRPDLTQRRVRKFLTGARFSLTFNPNTGGSGKKPISFAPDGNVAEGSNRNEAKWRVEDDGTLVLIAEDGKTFSRFTLNPKSMQFQGEVVHPDNPGRKQVIDLVSTLDE